MGDNGPTAPALRNALIKLMDHTNGARDAMMEMMRGPGNEPREVSELHVLRARLIGGQLNKERRGELWIRPPLGMVFDTGGKLMLDPDDQVQGAVRLVFDTFRRSGSAGAVVRYFREQQLVWPRRVVKGPRAGVLVFGELERHRVLAILHNPRYAAYVNPARGTRLPAA